MSDPKDDGGPAFPGKICVGHTAVEEAPVYEHPPGMTLRDYFAGQALARIAGPHVSTSTVATWAYGYADAMLAERAKR